MTNSVNFHIELFNQKKGKEKLSRNKISLRHIEVGIFRIASWTGINLGSCIWKWKMPLHHPAGSFSQNEIHLKILLTLSWYPQIE